MTRHDHSRDGEAVAAIACRSRYVAVAVRDGRFGDPHVWRSGYVPGPGTDVIVLADVEYDVTAPGVVYPAAVVRPHARLRHSADRDTALHAGTLVVLEGGRYECGTPDAPIPAGLSADVGFAPVAWDEAMDPDQMLGGLLAWGDVSICGAEKTAWARLAQEPSAGASGLVIDGWADGWAGGDRLAIPPSGGPTQWRARRPVEVRTVSRVVDGGACWLDRGLDGIHHGARDADGTLRFLPHAANLTRNVVVRSLQPGVRRGHMMLMGRCRPVVRYVNILDVGRTRSGADQIGRYACHLHLLEGA